MTARKLKIIDDFYTLSELLNDNTELITEMIDKVCRVPCIRGRGVGTKAVRKKTLTKLYIERADYEKLANDIDTLLSMPIQEFKAVKSAIMK